MELVDGADLRSRSDMDSSTFHRQFTPDLAERLSVGYSRNRATGAISAEQATREHFGRGYKVPNGGIYSTVIDMAKFAAAIMGESPVQILSPVPAVQEMMTPQATGGRPTASASRCGSSAEGVTTVGHGGSVAGYNANLAFDPDSRDRRRHAAHHQLQPAGRAATRNAWLGRANPDRGA